MSELPQSARAYPGAEDQDTPGLYIYQPHHSLQKANTTPQVAGPRIQLASKADNGAARRKKPK